jgi:hypothetical protein
MCSATVHKFGFGMRAVEVAQQTCWLLELVRVRDGDEGAHGIEIHADRP